MYSRQTPLSLVKIGCWYTFCCDQDLKEITTDLELQEAMEWQRSLSEDGQTLTFWQNEEDARLDLAND